MAETLTMTGEETAPAAAGLSAADRTAYVDYLLHLGDAGLILGHRLSEWCGHGPILEEDIALTNIALDLIGQARMLLTYAGRVEGAGRDEDALAYRRDVTDFRNPLICEQPNGDFAMTVARQFLVSAWAYELFSALERSADPDLAGIAAKSLKEVSYHRRHAGEWLIRLGDGTDESKRRAQDALDDLWIFTDELFEPEDADRPLIDAGLVVDPATLRAPWEAMVDRVLGEATLDKPEAEYPRRGGRRGAHSEYLGYILADLQFLQRAYPDARW
ncbi:MAG: 1,2-phenylacetyl-CoA epoxidase subunit PaaC [Marivibrio sp.]|uniref:1,2-phenylacetyl-CoA epoxidase subunit PaaC n=1 Tax=Marivibrio sp. TaxID=2039719 RepID=UPI0032EB185A